VRIIVLSGLSGSGKSVALRMLEDLDFYCMDNLPAALLKPFIAHAVRSPEQTYGRAAVGLDARNSAAEIATVPQLIDELRRSGIECEAIFLTAADEVLLRRFAETRRTHPMGRRSRDLRTAISLERQLMEPIAQAADLIIDTSHMGMHALRDLIAERLGEPRTDRLAITFESFAFKEGIPGDADFVFDARSLPNPYWEPGLRSLTGRDLEVVRFLESHSNVSKLIDDIAGFVRARIPEYQASNRGYLTVAVGCTGGQHRSVYIVERLAERFAPDHPSVRTRHTAPPAGSPEPSGAIR
jgi:UPF0042 nucleotide-binding protein